MLRGSASLDVEDRLFRALAVLRFVLLANTIMLTVYRWQNFDHPRAGAFVVAGLAVWTFVVVWFCADRHRRRDWLIVLDFAIAVAALLITPLIKGDFNASIPGFWVAGPMLACAIRWRLAGGLVAGVVIAIVDLGIRDEITQSVYSNVFLLLVGGVVVGHMTASVEQMAEQRATAERLAAASAERSRLARAVHDGVLQVLAMVQRRGRELGGESADLGRLAAEQESSLRALIRQQDNVALPEQVIRSQTSAPAVSVDLSVALEKLGSGHVTVVTPGGEVRVGQHVALELLAATGEALANVVRHVGAQAPVWILLDATSDTITISIRDEGSGIPEGRLAAAQAEGRLGVVGSICGRLRDLGGRARLDTGPQGTEWELIVSRIPPSVSATHQPQEAP